MLDLLIGTIAGIILGLLGIHINNALPLLSLYLKDAGIASATSSSYISSYIPSYLLNIPDKSENISFLPGHRLAIKGRAIEAIKTSLISSGISLLVITIISPFLINNYQKIYEIIKPTLVYILIIFSGLLILRSKKIIESAVIFILAGLFGIVVFSFGNYFFPMFSGFFAIPALLFGSNKVIKQKQLPGKVYILHSIVGAIVGALAVILPAINSPAQFTTFISIFLPINTLSFLALSSAISSSVLFSSILFYNSTGKARQGFLTALSKEQINYNYAIIGFAIAIAIIYYILKRIDKVKIDYRVFRLLFIGYILFVSYINYQIIGIIILLIASAIGLITNKLMAERINLMGSLIIPTIRLLL